MDNQNYLQPAQQPSLPTTPKDRTKIILAVIIGVLSIAILFESFALAVITSNYYGVFESDYDDEGVNYDDDPTLYEGTQEE